MRKILSALLILALSFTMLGAAAPESASPFVGNWAFYSQEGSVSISHEQVLEMAEQGLDMTKGMVVSFLADGTQFTNIFGELLEESWSDGGDGSGVFSLRGEHYPMTVEDGFLHVEMPFYVAVFEQTGRSAEELAKEQAASWQTEGAQGSGEVIEVGEFVQPAQEASDSALVGDWIFYSRESDDPAQNVPHEALPALKEQGEDHAKEETLRIGADGWFKYSDFSGFEQNNWTDAGDGTGSLVVNGERALLSIEDGLLVLRTSDSLTRYERAKTAEIALGTTGYVIAIPVEYREGEVTEAERADGQIAYYCSDEHRMDFDVYQFTVGDRTLEEYAAAEAAEYGADEVESLEVNGIPLALYYSEEEYEGGVYRVANYLFAAVDSFAELSFRLDGDEAEALCEAIVQSLERRFEDDMPGVVLEKLEGDYFLDHYLVRGETGEVFEAEYFGFEDLAPGDEVEISQRGAQDYSISKPFRRPSNQPAATPAPLYAAADGVAIREVKVAHSGQNWYFLYTLYNSADTDKSFDPSPFVLKAADGTELKTAIALVSPDEVWANNRTSVSVGILDGDRIQLGDEIEVWYDGTYLETVTAQEF